MHPLRVVNCLIIVVSVALGQLNFMPSAFTSVAGQNGYFKDGYYFEVPKVNYLTSKIERRVDENDDELLNYEDHDQKTAPNQNRYNFSLINELPDVKQEDSFEEFKHDDKSSSEEFSENEPFHIAIQLGFEDHPKNNQYNKQHKMYKHQVEFLDHRDTGMSKKERKTQFRRPIVETIVTTMPSVKMKKNEDKKEELKEISKGHKKQTEEKQKGEKLQNHQVTVQHNKHGQDNKSDHHKENENNMSKQNEEAGHYKKIHEAKKAHKFNKFGEKKGHKKGHKTKGYHNKFVKDEIVQEHKFYDTDHHSGHYDKRGGQHDEFAKSQGDYKEGHNDHSGQEQEKHGKKHVEKKGEGDVEHKDFKNEEGHSNSHQQMKSFEYKSKEKSGAQFVHDKISKN